MTINEDADASIPPEKVLPETDEPEHEPPPAISDKTGEDNPHKGQDAWFPLPISGGEPHVAD